MDRIDNSKRVIRMRLNCRIISFDVEVRMVKNMVRS